MVIGKFILNGTDWVVVKLENATHVMPETDWKWTYGKLHPERWNRKQFNTKKRSNYYQKIGG